MNTSPQPKRPDESTPNFAGIPEFAKAIRGLAHVSKKELNDAIAKEKAAKKTPK